MNFPMTLVGPTPEQAVRIGVAIRQARSAPSQREQQLSAVENATRMTGSGLPEEVVEGLIDMVLDRTPPRVLDDLVERLFGRLPDTLFEELGQLAALRRLSERLVATLLRTLGYAGDLARPAASLFNLCEEQAMVLDDDLRREVTGRLAECRQLADYQMEYEFTAMHHYRGGKFETHGRGLDDFGMDKSVEDFVRSVLGLRNLADRCEEVRRQG